MVAWNTEERSFFKMPFQFFRNQSSNDTPGANAQARSIIVGLGNPGPKYAQSRHNVGFWCIDALVKTHGITLSRRRQKAAVGEGEIDGRRVAMAKPRTFMNSSGEAVRYLLDLYRAKPEGLLVMYDDMDLPVGKLRIRPRGSAGGHRGIQSIISSIGTEEFPRIRVGVGRPPEGMEEIPYVLGRFPPEERRKIEEASREAAEAVVCLLSEGVEEAMNRYN